ncbi:HNH endonuclease [Tunturiibacter psychrotolerans]|uniref:HNH endonuclease n=1 Tax=Tunturiibacter psychrotolerans TaxID=3069686 RepID=UPI003D1A98FD
MAIRSKQPCRRTGCPELVDKGYCDEHTDLAKAHDRWRGTANSRGYDAAWKVLRVIVLKRDKYLCLICLAAGRVTAALDVDHIIPISIAPERRLDKTNCQSLCRACHRIKTAAEQRT